jgi:acyl carrier protein
MLREESRMTEERIREILLRILKQVAPEADLDSLNPEQRFRDQLDFDSVDFLNFALALQDQWKISIPEEDYPSLGTLTGSVSYLLLKTSRCESTGS